MKRQLTGTLVFVLSLLIVLPAAADVKFDAYFKDKTMRFDYYHTGTATEEHFAVDRMVMDGIWAGSKSQLIDELGLGK